MRVTHIHRKVKGAIFIGRPGIYGNPFVIGKDGDRFKVIDMFETYARENKQLLESINRLPANAVLACYCYPLKCHGDIIVKLWKELPNVK